MIPNFCLDSQPSGIPLILHGLYFGFQPIKAPSIVSQFFFLTHVLHTSLSLSLFLSFLPLSSFFANMATREASVSSSTYCAPQHLPP